MVMELFHMLLFIWIYVKTLAKFSIKISRFLQTINSHDVYAPGSLSKYRFEWAKGERNFEEWGTRKTFGRCCDGSKYNQCSWLFRFLLWCNSVDFKDVAYCCKLIRLSTLISRGINGKKSRYCAALSSFCFSFTLVHVRVYCGQWCIIWFFTYVH